MLVRSREPAEGTSSARLLSAGGTLELTHSWPLWEQAKRFDLGLILNSVITDQLPSPSVGNVGIYHAGCWEYDFASDTLTWSGGVYDIFGLPRGSDITRTEALSLYRDECRTRMETLRAYAIKHRRGFTIDVELEPASGGRRWMRLVAAPVVHNGRVTKLHGLKLAL